MEFCFTPHYRTWVFHVGFQSRSLNYLNSRNASCALNLLYMFLLLNSLQYREYQKIILRTKIKRSSLCLANGISLGTYLGSNYIVFKVLPL